LDFKASAILSRQQSAPPNLHSDHVLTNITFPQVHVSAIGKIIFAELYRTARFEQMPTKRSLEHYQLALGELHPSVVVECPTSVEKVKELKETMISKTLCLTEAR